MASRNHRSYHTDLKVGAFFGLLPAKILAQIPRSTLSDFRKQDPRSCFGSEFSEFSKHIDVFRELSHHKSILATTQALIRISHFLRSHRLTSEQVPELKNPETRRRVLELIARLRPILPLTKILKYLNLTSSKIAHWSRNVATCFSSPLSLCRKRHPGQLTVTELRSVRQAYKDPHHQNWPMGSVAWSLIHQGLVVAHPRTIISYAKRLGLAERRKVRKVRKRGSLSTSGPNQAWHCDTTILRTGDSQKCYVQLVMDNFSRKVLAWRVGAAPLGTGTAQLLRLAWAQSGAQGHETIDLIVDGGSENNNCEVDEVLSEIPLRKLIAQTDVSFSNSMIEALNKTLKYQYLFCRIIPNLEKAESVVGESVQDYNSRPHCGISGLSPSAAHSNEVFDKASYRRSLVLAAENRRNVNKASCSPCVPWEEATLQ